MRKKCLFIENNIEEFESYLSEQMLLISFFVTIKPTSLAFLDPSEAQCNGLIRLKVFMHGLTRQIILLEI